MPEEAWSSWDHLDIRYTGLDVGFVRPPIEAARARHRLRAIHTFLELEGRRESGTERLAALADLARDVNERRHYWADRATLRPHRALAVRTLPPWLIALGGFVTLVAAAAGAFAGGRWGGPFMGVLSLGTLGAVVCFRPRRGVLAGIILRHATCPDCGYRLAETQPAFPPAECLGVWFGPRACPECGSAWPMIPPPVFDAGV